METRSRMVADREEHNTYQQRYTARLRSAFSDVPSNLSSAHGPAGLRHSGEI